MKVPGTIIGGLRFSGEIQTDAESLEARLTLFEEPEEEIRLLGLMVQDVKLAEQMLVNLHVQNSADYRSNLIVARGAAERLKQRCTRLLGDGDVEHTPQNGRTPSEKRTVKRTLKK